MIYYIPIPKMLFYRFAFYKRTCVDNDELFTLFFEFPVRAESFTRACSKADKLATMYMKVTGEIICCVSLKRFGMSKSFPYVFDVNEPKQLTLF